MFFTPRHALISSPPLLEIKGAWKLKGPGSIKFMGLASRTADRVMADLFQLGIVTSKTPKGPVELALPMHLLRHLFPRLWPEAEANSLN